MKADEARTLAANTTRFGQAFQPRRHIDAVAEQVAIPDHDVADIDADAEH